MDYNKLISAVASDSNYFLPSNPLDLKIVRDKKLEDWLTKCDVVLDRTQAFGELRALEFLSKIDMLPGILPVSSLPRFLQSQASRELPVAWDTINLVSDAMRWILGKYDPQVASDFCRHGPGAVIEALSGIDKWLFELPPHHELTGLVDPLCRIARGTSCQSVSRFCEVPKTTWTTRGICIEPTVGQFFQQGIAGCMRRALQSFGVNISNCWKTNIELLSDPAFQTIDLSAASDSITTDLIDCLAAADSCWFGTWSQAMYQARSNWYLVPVPGGTGVVSARSFASMGNGFCFTLLTAVCIAAVIAAMRMAGVPIYDRKTAMSMFHRYASVYGDDIVIHEDFLPHLRVVLTQIGMTINVAKSSSGGPLRESCGAYVFHIGKGSYMTHMPRLRFFEPCTPSQLISVCNTQRELECQGWSETAAYLASYLGQSPWSRFLRYESLNRSCIAFNGTTTLFTSQQSKISWSSRRSMSYRTCFRLKAPERPVHCGDGVGWCASFVSGGIPTSEPIPWKTPSLQRGRVYE